MLKEHHGVVVADGGQQQALGGVSIRRADAFESRDVAEQRVEGLGVLGGAAEPRADAGEHDERNLDLPAEHVAHLGGVVEQLVHADADEIDEHQLGDGAHTGGSGADGGAHEGSFGERGVQHALVAELLNQAAGGAERAAPGVHDAQMLAAGAAGDFLAHDDDGGVATHFLDEGFIDGFAGLDFASFAGWRHHRGFNHGGHIFSLQWE